MRIPGVRSIAWCPVASVPADFELQAMAGTTPVLEGISFTALSIRDGATLELTDSNENNGSNKRVSLDFICLSKFKAKHCAFVVTCRNGAIYLIGTASSVPAVSIKDITAAPSAANNTSVHVELSSPCAWIEIEGQVAMSGPYPPIEYEAWREITEEEITTFINGLD